ncbi:MAG TPA: PKD domain-containing protein, partial [Bacteroidales bacterium]|nr:PKD domain-containing protein [Bacteroidales bacterium]
YNNGCASDTVHFNSSAFVNTENTTSWLWNFGDNTTSTEPDPHHIYAQPGTYIVSLTITNQNGCTNLKIRKVQVSTAPVAMFTHTNSSCSGTAVLFSDFSSAVNGTITSWNWNFDDGESIRINAPANPGISHKFARAGMYHVTLTISTSNGCYATHTSEVKIYSAQESAFSFTNGCDGTPAQFTDLTQPANGYAITSWSWNFGDPATGISNTSTMRNPKHRFSGMGVYEVSLTTENSNGCRNTTVRTISIVPEKEINFNQPTACYGVPANFSADTTTFDQNEVASYLWNFGDGSATSSAATPNHQFARPGNYLVTLTITKKSGCSASVSKTITVHTTPVAQFTTSGSCAFNQVVFTDNSYSADGEKMVKWAWNFGVNTSDTDTSGLQNPSFIYEAEGTYTARLTVTSASGCSAVKAVPVKIIPGPSASFSYFAEPCHNGSVVFTDKSVSTQSMITGWQWEFAPGIYSNLQNPVHVFGDNDTCHLVKLTVTTANGCSNTVTQRVCIPSPMKVDVNYTQACFGGTTWFNSTLINPADGAITSYKWNFGDPATGYKNESKLANPDHTFSKAGTFVVSLQVSDLNNCSSTRYISVVVDALPKPEFSYSGGACDSLVKFKNETSGAKIAQWIWKFGDGKMKVVNTPSNPDVTHYYRYPGIYEVTLITQSEAGCYDTIIKQIRRTPCMKAAFAVNDPVVCQKRSMKFTETSSCEAPIASWQWFFGDGTSVTYTSPQPFVEHTYATPGNYKVKMVVATQMVGGMATDTAGGQVAVNPAAIAAYSFKDACVGNATTFDNLTQNNNTTIKSYQWNFGDAASANNSTSVPSPQYNFQLPGQYDVKLVVTNTLGCSDTVMKKVNIFASPAADFSWTNNCEAKPVYFTDNSVAQSSSITSWNWQFGQDAQVMDATTKKSCSVSFTRAGSYDASLKVTDRNGCSTLVSKQITIHPTPVAAFNIVENYENKQGQVMLSNGTINGTDYEWNISNGKSSTSEAPVITFDKEGHYNIQLIAHNGTSCADTLTMEYDLMFKGLYVPNALNPGNMDPEVAVFRPKGVNLKSYYIEIFDRWGNPLWSSSKLDSKGSPEESWDGTLHGQVLKSDVYIWKISAQFNDGEVWDGKNAGNNENIPQMKAGTVTLIR